MEKKRQLLQGAAGSTDRPACEQLEVSPHESLSNPRVSLIGGFLAQVLTSEEETLKDFELRIAELKSRGGDLQADQASTSNLLKLQVTSSDSFPPFGSRKSCLNRPGASVTEPDRTQRNLQQSESKAAWLTFSPLTFTRLLPK